jgi:hypothetical protein
MNTVQTALSSARFNRLMLWLGILVLAAGALVLVLSFAGGSDEKQANPSPGFKASLPEKIVPLKNAQGVAIKTFWQLDPSMRATIRKFLGTAVMRRHLDEGWAVTAPSLRNLVTHKTWMTGNLPVVPYPIDNLDKVQYYLDYASTKAVLVEVGLGAKKKKNLRPVTFQLELVPVGKGVKQRWLVDYWMPRWTPPVPSEQ